MDELAAADRKVEDLDQLVVRLQLVVHVVVRLPNYKAPFAVDASGIPWKILSIISSLRGGMSCQDG